MKIVDKHTPRNFSAISHDGGIVLCDDQNGAFLCIRFPQEVTALVQLLNSMDIERIAPNTGEKL